MRCLLLLVTATLAGCVSHPAAVVPVVAVRSPESALLRLEPSHVVETAYAVSSYREPADPSLQHEAHVITRTTRVPAQVTSLETAPREFASVVTYAPLADGTELAAELGVQKEITAELRTIRSGMADLQGRAQAQYTTLLAQTAETLKVRRQLEEERNRLRAAPLASPTAAEVPKPAAAEPTW